MNTVQKLVVGMEQSALLQLVDDYEQFERDAQIGDCPLRKAAEDLGEQLGSGTYHVVTWMERIAFEAYRELYYRTKM